MQELVVISGKGGTGKTSITASLAMLAKQTIIADCDVDAANLHILLNPKTKQQYPFFSGKEASINQENCKLCGKCIKNCNFDAIKIDKNNQYYIDTFACEGCGVCFKFCPNNAVNFKERLCGNVMISETNAGPFVHATMTVGAENSGKLVTHVRDTAKSLSKKNNTPLIIVDGPPGIGCPAIASITGADKILIVTEPTISGLHDMIRALKLTKHFNIPSFVCVNKWDINPEMTSKIEQEAITNNAIVLGRICYDEAFINAQLERKTIIDTNAKSADDIKEIWKQLKL